MERVTDWLHAYFVYMRIGVWTPLRSQLNGIIVMVMAQQNVFMASMAFFVSLKKVRARYLKLRERACPFSVPFIYYPNAKCRYWGLGGIHDAAFSASNVFFFKSRHNGKDSVWRKIEINPFLVELDWGNRKNRIYFLVLLVAIDKVFDNDVQICYSREDFCTEFDLVNLKKAFFERGNGGLNTSKNGKGMNFYCWLQLLLWDLEGKRRKNVRLSFSIIDVCVQRLDIADRQNTLKSVSEAFQKAYYENSAPHPINDYLRQPIISLAGNGISTESTVLAAHFVYGLLYANDNFMMVDTAMVNNVVDNFYTNNKVERFWADDESIVHVKTNAPYYNERNQQELVLSGNLQKELQGLLEMCLLVSIKQELQGFKMGYKGLSVIEIENKYGMLARLLYNKLFNQTEMDKRMDYFIKQFRLQEKFEEIKSIVTPRKSSLEIAFVRYTNIWIIIISVLTLLATVISIMKSK